jgi:hypothetical protein
MWYLGRQGSKTFCHSRRGEIGLRGTRVEPQMLALDPNCLVGVQVNAMRRQLAIRVSGFDAPGPVESFEQCGLDVSMLAVIKGMK